MSSSAILRQKRFFCPGQQNGDSLIVDRLAFTPCVLYEYSTSMHKGSNNGTLRFTMATPKSKSPHTLRPFDL